MGAQNFKELATDPDFLEWFWQGTNGNDLIRGLNTYAQDKGFDRIRREKESPHVYAIILNKFPIGKSVKWKPVKVGFTQKSIKKGTNNRMEQLQKQIESELKEAKPSSQAITSILFAVRIGSVDTRPFHETEDRIRRKVGKPLTKAKAKELNLPVPTEWVLANQDHIDEIKAKLDHEKAAESKRDLVDIFKNIVAPPSLPEEFQDWVEEEEGKKEKKPERLS